MNVIEGQIASGKIRSDLFSALADKGFHTCDLRESNGRTRRDLSPSDA